MCGIAGFVGVTQPLLIEQMCEALHHRGPDSQGILEFPQDRAAIGMRRLAIIDLQTGAQPMTSPDGLVHLVFNGEIYNYRELRSELQSRGHQFRTTSDTEVVLQAYLAWGPDAWKRLHGMFALAIADYRNTDVVIRLVRDRVGMKPLYYIFKQGALVFASEIKALLRWNGFSPSVSLAAISAYLTLRYVPGPGSMFDEVWKLPAGHELAFKQREILISRWWSPPQPAPLRGRSDDELVAEFGAAIRHAVRRHMISDVPIGAFLSGGIDSTVIAALMAEVSSQPIRTFSIGFADQANEDTAGAARTAAIIGANHTTIDCHADDFGALPDIAWFLDEPVGDPIVVPMYVLAREARKSAKVVLSGEGADEILGGYLFHQKIVDLMNWRSRLPSPIWPLSARIVESMPTALLNRFFDYPGQLGSEGRRKVAKLLRQTEHGDLGSLYRNSITLFDADEIADIAHNKVLSGPPSDQAKATGTTNLARLLSLQFEHWLPDDILMKSDKMTMAHSLECRVPFMDELVISAAADGGDDAKIRQGVNKWVLRKLGAELAPDLVTDRPKRAFYAPLAPYLRRKPLAEIADWALDPQRLSRRGLFNLDAIARLRSPDAGQGFLQEKRLFAIMMLELWFERFAPDSSWL